MFCVLSFLATRVMGTPWPNKLRLLPLPVAALVAFLTGMVATFSLNR